MSGISLYLTNNISKPATTFISNNKKTAIGKSIDFVDKKSYGPFLTQVSTTSHHGIKRVRTFLFGKLIQGKNISLNGDFFSFNGKNFKFGKLH